MAIDSVVSDGGVARDSPAAQRRVYVVAGMHRAGTSVVARALQALGVDLGDRLMSADVRMNPRGFFEDVDVVKLDDALLDALGADWKSLAPLIGIDWAMPAWQPAVDDACRLLAARLARSGQFGFKDPRAPRLLPFWQRAFAQLGAADHYLIAVRHPLSVAASLTARDGLDERRSGWLWVTHTLCALHYTAGRPRVVVDYDRLLAEPDRELGRMARALGLPASCLPAGDVAQFKRDFLADELRHARHRSDDLGRAGAIPLLADVHALVQDLACGAVEPEAAANARIGDLFGRLNAAAPLLSYAGSMERVADEVPRIEGELAWARASLAQATAFNGNLQEALDVAKNYNHDLVAVLARKDEELAAAYAKLTQLQGKLRLAAEPAWQRLVRQLRGKK